ncbi:cytochrome b [Rhodobacterales bacterium HKCCE3408]|nr:cytochrome b [Rhodobacterales bacterium HKCCE3408]
MEKTGYSATQIALHWATAIAVLAAYLLSEGMGRAHRILMRDGLDPIAAAPIHVWLGLTVFALVVIRLAVRAISGAPAPLATGWMELAAKWGHRLIYLLLIVTPITGFSGWFLGIDLGEPHNLAANALMLVAGGHAVVAIGHHYLKRDGTLTRMLRPAPR